MTIRVPTPASLALIGVCWAMAAFSGLAQAQETGVVTFGQSLYSVNNDQTNAPIIIVSTGSTDGVATVIFTTSDGTATAGVNYATSTGVVTFAAGVLTNTVNISILGNVPLQSTQTVNLALSNPTGFAVLGISVTATLSIINTSAQQVAFLQSAYSVNGDQSNTVITVVRTGGTNGMVSVNFATSDGTAKAGVDYTATNGTLAFADGILTNTFMVSIVPDGPYSTNQTLTLTLSTPQGVILGSPNRAVLTIVANGPPLLQLSAAEYDVHEHVGKATVTAIRFGDSSGSASVVYGTSDGTAQNGIDYLGTSGTLMFPSGAESASFSFQFIQFPSFQSNKTVVATLSDPIGASLGTQVTAVVTIVNDQPQTIIVTNGSGELATITLLRAGTMQASTNEPVDVVLDHTDETSLLGISVKKKKGGGGTGLLQVDGISGGALRSINAPGIDLVGSGVQVSGHLQQLRVHDILNGATVSDTGNTNQDTKIVAHDIGDGTTVDLGSRIQSLLAARFGAGTINAPRLAKMVLKGDKRNGIPGDCGASFTLSGDGVPVGKSTLGTLLVAGAISNASINVAGGNVGKIIASQMIDTTVYVGFTPGDPSHPLLGGTFVPDLHMQTISIRATTNGFIDSFLVAPIMGTIHLASVTTDNAGVPFGVLANQNISLVAVKAPPFKWKLSGATDQSSTDFHVILP